MLRRIPGFVPLAIAMATLAFVLAPFLFPLGWLPARGGPDTSFPAGDLTSQFALWIRVAVDSLWQRRELPFWNPYVLAGAPLFALPQAGVFSLAALLGGFVGVNAGVKLSLLAHLWLGMAGVARIARRLGAGPIFSAVGALLFGLNPFVLGHLWIGHLNIVNPVCVAPWTFYLLARALTAESDRWRGWAIGCGISLGAQLWEGGDSVILYEGIAGALGGLCLAPAFARILAVGSTTALSAFAFSAPQFLAMSAYLPLTGRTAGLRWELANDRITEVAQAHPGLLAQGLALAGVLWLWARGRRRQALAWGAITGASFLIAGPPWAFHLLWRFVPTFNYQRIPERALSLAAISVPVLLAVGLQGIWALVLPRRERGLLRVVLALIFVAVPLSEALSQLPKLIPLASTEAEIAANPALHWLKGHAQAGERVHFWEVNSRDWGPDHVTVPAGLEVISGDTSSDHRDYLPFVPLADPSFRNFLTESFRDPAKFWGMLSVKYVVSSEKREARGFNLVAKVAPCPDGICQPASSAGTWIYENQRVLPRVHRVRQTIEVRGDPRPAFEAALEVMERPEFDPAVTAVIDVGTLRATGASRSTNERPGASPPGGYRRDGANAFQVSLPEAGWWVVSERVGLFPGWSARILKDGSALPIFRADGVLGAVYVNAPAEVRFEYVPPGFLEGVGIFSAAMLALGAIFFARV